MLPFIKFFFNYFICILQIVMPFSVVLAISVAVLGTELMNCSNSLGPVDNLGFFSLCTINNLILLGTYSQISDDDLDALVRETQQCHPNVGIRMLTGFLKTNGHRIQRERIRQSLLWTDPLGVMQRWRKAVQRRKYNVHSPLSLWHIDGCHKLIRYSVELIFPFW